MVGSGNLSSRLPEVCSGNVVNTNIKYAMQFRIIISFVVGCTLLWIVPGCKSFDDAIKPVIDNSPADDSARFYMTGTRPYSEADNNLQLNVWRIDADPFPDSVLAYTRVMDPQGNFISNLAPPYYTGSQDYKEIWSGLKEQIGDGGKVFEISDFDVREFSDKDGIPFEIALALDYSGSMGSNIKFLEDAALSFINLKLPQDRITIVKFDDTPKLVVPPTQSKQELIAGYGRTGLNGFGGYTALYAAGKLGGDQIVKSPDSNPRALILFTDGEDNASTVTSSELYDFCKIHNIPVFAVAFGAVNREVLQDIASGTGGRFYQTNDPKELEAIFKDIYLSLRNYYLIRYTPPRVDGKHIVTIALNPPGGGSSIGGRAVYEKYGYYTPIGETAVNTNVENIDTVTQTVNNINVPNRVLFGYNSAELLPAARDYIRPWYLKMQQNPNIVLEVGGHTDSVGTEEYNQNLSERRAKAVCDILIGFGVAPSRLRCVGYGETRPKRSNDTEEGRSENRRTEFKVLRQ